MPGKPVLSTNSVTICRKASGSHLASSVRLRVRSERPASSRVQPIITAHSQQEIGTSRAKCIM